MKMGREHRVPLCRDITAGQRTAGGKRLRVSRAFSREGLCRIWSFLWFCGGWASTSPLTASARRSGTGRRNAELSQQTSGDGARPYDPKLDRNGFSGAAISWRDGFPLWKAGRPTCLPIRRTAAYLTIAAGRGDGKAAPCARRPDSRWAMRALPVSRAMNVSKCANLQVIFLSMKDGG